MTAVLIIVIALLVIAVAVLAAPRVLARTRRPASALSSGDHRILFPFVDHALSERALDSALRLAQAEGATLVPVFLARVSLDLPLDTPLPRQCGVAVPLLEIVEQRATEAGIPVDSRIERGRNRRHALRQAIAGERFDQIVIAAASNGSAGFGADDVAWLLDNAGGEIIVLRPSPDDEPALAPAIARPRKPLPLRTSKRRNGRGAVSRVDEMAVPR